MEEQPFDVHLLAAAWVRAFCLDQMKEAARQMQDEVDDLREKAAGLQDFEG